VLIQCHSNLSVDSGKQADCSLGTTPRPIGIMVRQHHKGNAAPGKPDAAKFFDLSAR